MCEKDSVSNSLLSLFHNITQSENKKYDCKCNCKHLTNCSPGNNVNNESQQEYFGVTKK